MAKVYIDIDPVTSRVRGYSDSPCSDNCVLMKLNDDHGVFVRFDSYYYIDKKLVLDDSIELERAKKMKEDELGKACNHTTLGRFPCMVYGEKLYFSNDMEAQSNFGKAERAFDKGRLSEIPWTAYQQDGTLVRVVLNAEAFDSVNYNHLFFVQQNLVKFRDVLMKKVVDAETVEEVNSITWDMPL